MPTHASRRGLAAAELAQFERDGYLLIPDLFDPAELQPLIREIEEVIDQQAARLLAEGLITDPFEGEGFLTRLTRLTAQSDKVYWALAGGQHCGRQMFELIRHPRLLDVAEALLGPEIVASAAYRIRPKVPGFDHGVVPWHQDSGYFEATCDRSLILTVWMPLVNATPENGCLQVIPGMQRGPVVTHHRRAGANYLRIADEDLWLEQTVTVPVPLGGVLLLSNRTPHCSTPNTTDEVRWSVDIRYQGTDAPSPALPAELGAEALARAVERDGETPAAPACYAPEADFLVRSRLRPEAVVTEAEEFQRIRTEHLAGPAPQRWTVADAP